MSLPADEPFAAPASPAPRAGQTSRLALLACAALLAIAIALAYANSLRGPFVYDDTSSIVHNPTIRQLDRVADVLTPPGGGITVAGRPVLNASFAVNFAVGRLGVRGYHLVNLAMHAAAALLLFGVVRRTLPRTKGSGELAAFATPVALAIAALWSLHPLQTESVTYIVQRAEALMSLFYLLTLYAFVRSLDTPGGGLGWRVLAWTACLLGMGTKENMVSAPLIVLLYDRAFVIGTFRGAWAARRGFYVALASSWLLLAALVLSTGGNRGGSAGLGLGAGFFGYALTQVSALWHYLALGLWPHPLVFDYGRISVHLGVSFFAQAALVLAGVAALLWAGWRSPRAGFPGVAALAILAPTSLVPGTTQMIVEHRMYLPLAALTCLLIPLASMLRQRGLIVAAFVAAAALGLATAARNRVYQSAVTLWSDTVAKRPLNVTAHGNLGAVLREAGQDAAAMNALRAALKLDPKFAPALGNLGISLTEAGNPSEGLWFSQRALELEPRSALAHLYVAQALDQLGRTDEALPHFAEAVRLNPLLAAARLDHGKALARSGRLDDAVREFEAAIAIDPAFADAHLSLAGVLLGRGDVARAQAAFARGASLRADRGETQVSWANLLLSRGLKAEALAVFEDALKRFPDSAPVHFGYGVALTALERPADAVGAFEAALRLQPDFAEAHHQLGNTLATLGRLAESLPHYERSLQLRPDDPTTHNNLGLALAQLGRVRDALPHFESAVRLAPDFAPARENLARARAQLAEPRP